MRREPILLDMPSRYRLPGTPAHAASDLALHRSAAHAPIRLPVACSLLLRMP